MEFFNHNLSFSFILNNQETMLTFFGSGTNQISPSPNRRILQIDNLEIASSGEEVLGYGECAYDNPYMGVPASVGCKFISVDGGIYIAFFVSDGSEPEIIFDNQ